MKTIEVIIFLFVDLHVVEDRQGRVAEQSRQTDTGDGRSTNRACSEIVTKL